MAEHWKNEREKKQKSKLDEIVIGEGEPIKVTQDLNAEAAKVDHAVRREMPSGSFKLIAKTKEAEPPSTVEPINTFSTQLWERHIRDTMRQFLDWLERSKTNDP